MTDKIIITCAVTGGGDTHLVNPAVPVTPEQIAKACLEAEHAGAAIAHIHVRDPATGKASGELALFEDVVERLHRANSALIIELSCGRGGRYFSDPKNPGHAGEGSVVMSARERVAHVELIRPELCSLDVGTVNFDKFVYLNAPDELREMAKRIQSAGTKPDLDVFELGHVEFANQLVKEGLIDGPPIFQMALGARWGAAASYHAIAAMRDAMKGAHWSAADLGSHHPERTLAQAILLGGGVRVGLEDNLYIKPGELAKSNAQQVEQVADLIRVLGFSVATPAEARAALGMKPR